MLRTIITTAMGTVIVLLLAVVALLITADGPSTDDLDTDLVQISRDIADAADDAAKYSGGLLLNMIEMRASALKTTQGMLQAKRASVLRRINLVYIANGKAVQPAPADTLRNIGADIEASQGRILEVEVKARQYTGGLIQTMLLLNAETERVTHSQLLMSYYAAKYGMALPSLPSPPGATPTARVTPSAPKNEPLGTIVKDKDAL